MSIVKWPNLFTKAEEETLFKACAEVRKAGFGRVYIEYEKGKPKFIVSKSERPVVDVR